MKRFMTVISVLLMSMMALAALPQGLEFGMDLDDIEDLGVDYVTEDMDEFGPFTLLRIAPDEPKSAIWSETGAIMSEEDGVIAVLQVNGCPENSYQRRWNYTLRQIVKEYGEPANMYAYAAEHPFDEDMFFLALIGGITDEETLRETGLSFVAAMIVDEHDEVTHIWLRDDHSIAALVPASDTEIGTVFIAPDVLSKVAGTVRVLMLDQLAGGLAF